jgi:hypothetical protein
MNDSNYFGDVCYDVWRSGGNPDAVDRDRAYAAELDRIPAEDHAAQLMREDAARHLAARDEEMRRLEEEEYWRQVDEEAE